MKLCEIIQIIMNENDLSEDKKGGENRRFKNDIFPSHIYRIKNNVILGKDIHYGGFYRTIIMVDENNSKNWEFIK